MILDIPLEDLYWNPLCGMALFNTEEKLEKYLQNLQKSIEKIGVSLLPIVHVTFEKDKLRYNNKKYHVMQGNHRVEVAKRLGWKTIKCEVK